VRDVDSRVAAAVNISAHITRASVTTMRRQWLPELLATTARIEADLAQLDDWPGVGGPTPSPPSARPV